MHLFSPPKFPWTSSISGLRTAGKRHATGQFFLTTAPTPDGLANPLRAYLICKLGTATLASSHPSGVPEYGLGALFHLYLLYLRLTKSDTRANM